MSNSTELLKLINFMQANKRIGLFSTSATVVDIIPDVYNVSGSTKDPKIGGKSWKQLLISHGINDDCYVTNQNPPSGTSHNDFSVGGHVTDKANGIVQDGDITYLMPLCYWHNSTSRDGNNFNHTKTKMLELDGFMQGDTAPTFMARMSNGRDESSRIIFETDEGWDFKKLAESERNLLKEEKTFKLFGETDNISYFVITRNDHENGRFFIDYTSDDLRDF
ncbi:MAG: hypothetical protein ACPGVT_08800 [Maricaulaceae bacterium]